MVISGETSRCQTQYRISGCLYRGSSFSGRVTADGSCVGSKRALAKAVQRRNVLYESLLFDEQKIATQTRQSQLKRVSVEDSGGTSRRQMLQMGGTAALFSVATSAKAKAVSMPQALDSAWSAVGGGPADLSFPDTFLGVWLTESTLTKVETPLGLDYVPNIQNLQRALREDLNKKIRYEVAYIRNKKSKVIIDRRYNVRSLMNLYMGRDAIADDRISWNPDDPNRLSIQLPGGGNIVTRVVRRSEENPNSDRINTSEFFEQIFQNPGRPEPKVKASQCFTKYKFRSQSDAAQLGGPQIVATQVVSDYLTPYDGEAMMLQAQNRPVTIYTYTMSFRRVNKSYEA